MFRKRKVLLQMLPKIATLCCTKVGELWITLKVRLYTETKSVWLYTYSELCYQILATLIREDVVHSLSMSDEENCGWHTINGVMRVSIVDLKDFLCVRRGERGRVQEPSRDLTITFSDMC